MRTKKIIFNPVSAIIGRLRTLTIIAQVIMISVNTLILCGVTDVLSVILSSFDSININFRGI